MLFLLHKNFPRCDGCIVIFDGCWLKNIFTKISSYITVLNLEIIWRDRYSYLMSFVFGYYKSFTFVISRKMSILINTIESIIIFMTQSIDARCSWH